MSLLVVADAISPGLGRQDFCAVGVYVEDVECCFCYGTVVIVVGVSVCL